MATYCGHSLKEYHTELQNNLKIYNVTFCIKVLESMIKYCQNYLC